MEYSYAGNVLTIRADKEEKIRYRTQQMIEPWDAEKAYIEIPEGKEVTLTLDTNTMECVEVDSSVDGILRLPTTGAVQNNPWTVSVTRRGLKLSISGPGIHLSHIYMSVGGKKVFLSSTGTIRNGKEWTVSSEQPVVFEVEEYCKGFVTVK